MIFLLLFFNFTFSETTKTYVRKSISFYEGFIIQKNLNIPGEFVDTLFSRLKKTLFLKRFDYNPIPAYLQERVAYRLNQFDTLDLEKIGEILEKEFLPEIIKILDVAKEARAKEFVSREERINFLTSKAKEIGVTADDIEKVLNAAYIFVPFINGYFQIREKDLITVTLKGGIIWYHISFRFSPPKVIPNVKKTTEAFGVANIKKLNPTQFVFYSAMNAFLKNLEVITREIPDFRLSADIISAYKNEIYFNLGKKDGIRVDDKFNIVEFYEDENGIRRVKNVGYSMVTKIEETKAIARSYLGRCEAGMTLLERPRLPLDLVFRFVFLEKSFDIDFEFDYNVGRYFNLSQFFTTFNLLLGPKKESKDTIELKEIGFGLIKKFNFYFLSLGLEGKGKFTNEGIKPEGRGILEFFILPDFKLGGKIGYDGNLNYGLHLTYNPPTLPFDPFSIFRGLFGI